MRLHFLLHLLVFLLLIHLSIARRHYSEEEEDDDEDEVSTTVRPALPLPSKRAMEMVGVRFLDALIKRGQMEMAKGAFRTQLEVLEKVQPEQYKKYKKMSVDELAADAVLQQAEMAKLQPKTGNPMIDMLNENGIPIASSLKGIEQAIKTQKDLETQDPSEQIAKAVLEKFQQQILPGLVANVIAGKNPFKIPQMRQNQASPEQVRAMALAAASAPQVRRSPPVMRRQPEEESVNENEEEPEEEDPRSLARRLRSSPRLRHLLENADVAAALTSRMRDAPLGRPLSDQEEEERLKKKAELDGKAALVLGLHDLFNDDKDDDDEKDLKENSVRRSPLQLPSSFVESLQKNDEVKAALQKLSYGVNDVDKYLEPKKLMINPKPQPGYFVPRKLPQRPRKMLPLLIGADPNEESSGEEETRRSPLPLAPKESRVLTNLKNNPNIAPLFMDGKLEEILSGRKMLSDEQKGKKRVKTIKAFPRLFGAKTVTNPMDGKVSQIIEERPVPPLVWTPKGRHTRLRWTGATEKEIPGIGSRFILPSLDPTVPAVNTAYSTQGRAREEWDSMFKIPNYWQAGDEAGFSVKHNSQRFVGGNGGFDMPALGY